MTHAEPGAERRQMARRHVMVINGDPVFLNLMRALLQDERYNVTTTNFVPNSFAQIAALQPDLLILDLVIFDRAGWDLLARLAAGAATRVIPVLVTSTDPRLLERAEAERDQYGGAAWIAKLFELDDLLGEIDRLIGPFAPRSAMIRVSDMGETPRLTLREAADALGVPLDALRKWVYRGSINAVKIDGQYFLEPATIAELAGEAASDKGETSGETVLGHVSDRGETLPPTGMAADYIAALKDEITFLRDQLDKRSGELAQERERSDTLQRIALDRIEALTARPDDADADHSVPKATKSHRGATDAAHGQADSNTAVSEVDKALRAHGGGD